jgi:tetratricopeptide (TPR) repeat protein
LIVTSAALFTMVAALQPRVWALPSLPQARTAQELAADQLPLATRRMATFGYSKILSDWFWLKAIQYYGTPSNEKQHYAGLASLLEEATDFDPSFDYVYQFAGLVLPYKDSQTGLWYNTGSAIALLRKGAASGLTRWQVPWLLGYALFTFRGDYVEAGDAIERASQLPGAPEYMATLAVRLLAQGSDIETAIFLTQNALAETNDERVKGEIQDRLDSLVLQRDLDLLNKALTARNKVAPVRALSDLMGSPGLSTIPTDPFGGRYELDATASKVTSRHEGRLLRLYVHPGQPALEPYAD